MSVEYRGIEYRLYTGDKYTGGVSVVYQWYIGVILVVYIVVCW